MADRKQRDRRELSQALIVNLGRDVEVVGQGKVELAVPEHREEFDLAALSQFEFDVGVSILECPAELRRDNWRQRHQTAKRDPTGDVLGQLKCDSVELSSLL